MINTKTMGVPVSEVRKNLAQLLEDAHYNDQTISIVRQNKPMAFLVGSKFMDALEQVFKQDPALQETIEILMNSEESEDILASYAEYKESGAPIKLVEHT